MISYIVRRLKVWQGKLLQIYITYRMGLDLLEIICI